MATVLEHTSVASRVTEIREFRTAFYVSIRSTGIQRWGARIGRDDSYYMLTSTMWKASRTDRKNLALPETAKHLSGAGRTLYFDRREDAEAAAEDFVSKLIEAGIKV